MTSRDRIRAAISGKPVDRVPVAFWRHFPGDDQRAESLAAAHVNFQKKYQWDFLNVTARFAAETLASGADGIFFATAAATTGYLNVEEYEEFGRPYDLRVLEAAAGSELRILHIHGIGIMFDQLTDYPVDAINWHDRRTAPTLSEARHRFSGCLAGGINELKSLSSGTPEQIADEARDAIAQTGGTRHIVAAGCTIPIDITEERIRAVRAALEK